MPTSDQYLGQIADIVTAWRQPVTEPAPAPPSTDIVSTAAEVNALMERGGSARLAPSRIYDGNFIARKPVRLSGPTDAVLRPADPFAPTLTGLASDSTFSGFTVLNGAEDRDCVIIGDFYATTVAQQPQRVLLENLTVRAGARGGHRGIYLHGSDLTVRKCSVLGFWEVGRDAQAIAILNGPGPYLIEDNLLEGSGENIMVGGETIHISGCLPTDVTIQRNTLSKPLTWKTNGSVIKNLAEVKAGRNVRILDNILNGCWAGQGQNGTPIVLTVRNQNGDTPWVTVDDIVVAGNRVSNCKDGYAVEILGYDDEKEPSLQTQFITLENNLFADTPYGVEVINGVSRGLTVRRNTFAGIKKNFLTFDHSENQPVPVRTRLAYVENVARSGVYGITAAETAPGTPTLELWTPGYTFNGNLIELTGARTIPYPTGNRLQAPGTLAALLDPATLELLDKTLPYGYRRG